MRKYEPIWRKLKQTGQVSITANRLLHPRIIKAVIKEKWGDVGYKISIEPARVRLSYTSTHSVLVFYLTRTLSNYITAEDLEL
jgi:hypothetical protein